MIIELSTDNILTIVGAFGLVSSTVFGYWMKSVSTQNRVLKKELDDIKKELKKELDELSDCVQDTRLHYVTKNDFDKAMEKVDSKLEKIISIQTASNLGRRKEDYNNG